VSEQKREESKRQDAIRREIDQIYHLFEILQQASGLPPRMLEQTFENYRADNSEQRQIVVRCREYVKNFEETRARGTWLCFAGSCGTGKGHLAAAIAHEVIYRHLLPVVYVKLIELVSQIKETWKPHAKESEEEILEYYRKCSGLLILDEIGVQFGSETERMYLYRLLDYRYEYKLPTILTTNLTGAQLKATAGIRVYDRIIESPNEILVFNWPSYRKTGGRLDEPRPEHSKP
jgi:DNA replication protein DnaC